MNLRLLSTAVALTAGLVIGLPSAAHAQGAQTLDGRSDVVRYQIEGSSVGEATPAPGDTQTDISSVSYNYKRKALVVTAQVQRVDGRRGLQPVVRVRGGGTNHYFIGGPGGRVSEPRKLRQPRCEGGAWRALAATDTVRIRIPAACFSSPARVRLGFALVRATKSPSSATEYFDDVSIVGKRGAPTKVKLGPVVRRG